METDRVSFRTYKDGEVLAVLPDVEANLGRVTVYAHMGQHGEGDLAVVYAQSRLAKPSEYHSLLAELRSIGYRLRIVKRISRRG